MFEQGALLIAEEDFALIGKDLRDAFALLLLNQLVGVDELIAELLMKLAGLRIVSGMPSVPM